MYIVNQCLRCVSDIPSVTCGFCNRAVECCTKGKSQAKVKDHSDEDQVHIEDRDIKFDDTSKPISPIDDKQPRRRLLQVNDESQPQKSIANSQTSPEVRQYYEGDPLINFEIKKKRQKFAECKLSARGSRKLEQLKKEIKSLIEKTNQVKQRINFITLEKIKCTAGDIGQIRILLQGSVAECLRLFVEAEQAGDVITQIQLVWAFDAMCKDKDQDKDLSQLMAIKDDKCYSGAFNPLPFDHVCDIAFAKDDGFAVKEGKGAQALKKAIELNYFPAILLNAYQKWEGDTNCYGFANELATYVGKGSKFLDYSFGKALKNGSVSGSAPYYAGMFWMESSLGIKVMYANTNQSLDSFLLKDDRLQDKYRKEKGYYCDGFMHMSDGAVLASSQQDWLDFKTKLINGQHGLPTSYSLPHQMNAIADLMNEFQMGVKEKGSSDTAELGHIDGTSTIIVYENGEVIGEISVFLKTSEICKSMDDDDEIQPLIDFVKDSMIRGVSATSICSWINNVLFKNK